MKHLERAFIGDNFIPWYILTIIITLAAQVFFSILPFSILDIINPSYLDATDGQITSKLFDLVGRNLLLFLLLIPFTLTLVLFVLLIKKFHHRTLTEAINGRKKIRWNRIYWGFLIWSIIFAVTTVVNYILYPNEFIYQFQLSKFVPLLIITLLFIPIQALFEEVFFRGYLAQGVAALTSNRWLALIIPSLIFAFMHMQNPEVAKYGAHIMFFNYLAMALIWGLVCVLDDGLELAIGMHAANNILISLFMTEKDAAFESYAVFEVTESDPYWGLLHLVIIGAIVIAFFYKKYNWRFSALTKKVEKPANPTPSIN